MNFLISLGYNGEDLKTIKITDKLVYEYTEPDIGCCGFFAKYPAPITIKLDQFENFAVIFAMIDHT